MKTKIWFLVVLVACVAAVPLCAQTNFLPKGDDSAQSFGQFWVLIDHAHWAQFAGCPATYYDSTNHILHSPVLYESGTQIGRSAPLNEGSPQDNAGVKVGSANTIVSDAGMQLPSGFTPAAHNSHEVHTEIRHLNMVTFNAGEPKAAVRAGVCYKNTGCSPVAPPPSNRISRGEVVSNNATPGGTPDFPARSYFDVFAQIDVPACGTFPGGVVYNTKPLLVYAPSISSFPPSGVVYMHDTSSAVGVNLLTPPGGHGGKDGDHGKKHDRLGCIILAGHGIIPTFHRAELESTPSAVPVALQKPGPEREQRMRPPTKEEIEREAKTFGERMKQEHEREGGRHKDCGPDDDKDDD